MQCALSVTELTYNILHSPSNYKHIKQQYKVYSNTTCTTTALVLCTFQRDKRIKALANTHNYTHVLVGSSSDTHETGKTLTHSLERMSLVEELQSSLLFFTYTLHCHITTQTDIPPATPPKHCYWCQVDHLLIAMHTT